MKYKQVVKLIIDIAMYLIFVALMQDTYGTDYTNGSVSRCLPCLSSIPS